MALVINTANRSAIQKVELPEPRGRVVSNKDSELSDNVEIGLKGRMLEQINLNRKAAESSVLGADLAEKSLLLAKNNILGNPLEAQAVQAQSVNGFNISLLS